VISSLPSACKEFIRYHAYKHSFSASQFGQDVFVFGEVFNEKKNGFFLDIGAHDGVYLSNTFLLEYRYNWSGICVEANPLTFERLRARRRVVCENVCLDRTEGEVEFALKDVFGGIVDQDLDNDGRELDSQELVRRKTVPLARVLEKHHAPQVMDYLSIDVEGAEERILADFDFTAYRFRAMTIERPTGLLRSIFKRHGYRLVREIPQYDCFYIHEEIADQYLENIQEFYEKKHFFLRWK
jgi:FkbM family methyltransferase